MPGNPGLVEYYRPFIQHLHTRLYNSQTLKQQHASVETYARSFAGFEVPTEDAPLRSQTRPYTLNQQINITEAKLREAIATVDHPGRTKVILMGHSLGGWMTLELISRLRLRLTTGIDEDMNVIAGVCLFTPVTHLARSPGGQRGARLLGVPFVPMFLIALAQALALLPWGWLHALVQSVTGMPPRAAAVTSAFVASPHGVPQSLSLVKDELHQITHDRWDEELWGASGPSPTGIPRAKLWFYFGETDPYVLEAERAELMQKRGRVAGGAGDEWKPLIEIDQAKVPHAFVMRKCDTCATCSLDADATQNTVSRLQTRLLDMWRTLSDKAFSLL